MTHRSAVRGPGIIVSFALIVSLPAFAQTPGTQAVPAQAGSPTPAGVPQAVPSQATAGQATATQAVSTQAAPAQGAPTQAAPTRAAPAQAVPNQAVSAQGAASPPATQAAPVQVPSGPAYDIEIVIFRTKVALGQPENWTAEATVGATVAGAETASGSGPVGKLLTVLPTPNYRLTSIESRLRTSGTYQPVAHAAWVQTASAWGTHAGFSLESLGINVPGLTGVIFLERGEFLHLGMTLDYTMQDPPPGLDAPPGTTFIMNETRRVRFYQRNYYDHPAFGVIALVTPARGPRPPGR